jgi:hypothetical protein
MPHKKGTADHDSVSLISQTSTPQLPDIFHIWLPYTVEKAFGFECLAVKLS